MKKEIPIIKVSLTDFVNFIVGQQYKESLIQGLIRREQKSFFSDYYLPLQRAIICYHQQQRHPSVLQAATVGINIFNKTGNSQLKIYPTLIQNYLQTELAQTKTCTWFAPPAGIFTYKNLSITIKPELGLRYKRKGTSTVNNYLIKLYYKKEVLSRAHANVALALMQDQLDNALNIPTEYCILDLRRGKLFYRDKRMKNPMNVVVGEAESFLTIWALNVSSK